MNKSIIFNTTPFLFVTDVSVGNKRALAFQGLHSGIRRRGLKQGLITIVLDEDEVKNLKNELQVVKLLKGILDEKSSRSISMERYDLIYGLNRLELLAAQKPGQPSISLHNLVKNNNLKIDQKWFLDGFNERFSAMLESFIQKEDLSVHALEETVTGGKIQLYGNDSDVPVYQQPNKIFHVTMEAADGISYLVFSDQGNVNFAIRNTTELKEIEHLVKEIDRSSFGLNFAGVLNTNPKAMMTAYQSLNLDWKVFNENSYHFIIVQTGIMMFRRIKFNPTEKACDDFKIALKGIKEDFVNRYITREDGGLIHIEVETGSTPIRNL